MFISEDHAQDIVNEMKQAIHRNINIMDQDGRIFASTDPARKGQLHTGALRILRERLPELTIEQDDPEAGVQAGVNLPICLRGTCVGVIGISGDPGEVSIFGDIIKRMTEMMVEDARAQEQEDLMNRARSQFVENWLFARQPDWTELELRGQLLDLEIQAPYTLALLRMKGAEEPAALDELHSSRMLNRIRLGLRAQPKHYCAVIRNRVIVLLYGSDWAASVELVRGMIRDLEGRYALRIRGGISSLSRGAADIRRCYLEARTAVQVAEQSESQRLVSYHEATFELAVQSIPGSICRDLGRVVFSGCTEPEREQFSQLIRTYYQQCGSINQCAEALYIHRNTVQYRMQQLREKSGYDLRHPKEALLLYLAVRDALPASEAEEA